METINILCATDENYAPYCGIMLTSLFESNRDCRFRVFVLTDDLFSDTNVNKFNRLGQKYENEITLKTVDETMLRGFPTDEEWVTLPTYYRLLAARLLPEDVHKIIYFDCDIAVVGDILPLWQMDLTGKAIAGARGYGVWEKDPSCERLGIDFFVGYFNAGVLLINLDYWRANGVTDALLEYIITNYKDKSKFLLRDQDTLNVVLQNKKIYFPDRFNFRVYVFTEEYWESYSLNQRKNYLEECKLASVIHYISGGKPWEYRSYGGPFYSDWEKYRRKSLWRDCRDTKPLRKHIKHIIKRYFFPRFFREQHRQWVVLPENKRFYKDCIV